MFPICVHLKGQNSGTPEFWWSIFFASKFLRKGWIAPKSDVSDFGYFNAPKSGTPDFGVKPGNDSGNRAPLFCIHSTEICF
jgi:hypothetical protein